jgi:hypothetical protein
MQTNLIFCKTLNVNLVILLVPVICTLYELITRPVFSTGKRNCLRTFFQQIFMGPL